MSPRKAAAAKKAAASSSSSRPAKKAQQWVAWDRTRSRMVGGLRDSEEDAQTIVDGLKAAGYSAEVRKA